jgi:hypothetical protein
MNQRISGALGVNLGRQSPASAPRQGTIGKLPPWHVISVILDMH